ncbi:MAG: hypothetical protein ACXU8A_10315 [Burkholderiaceae bacterium]
MLRLYTCRTTSNTLDFLAAVLEEMPFAFQRIQTDRGREFFPEKFSAKAVGMGAIFDPSSQ